MRTESFVVDTPDGARLHGRVWLPDGEPTAVVQVAHGMAEHSGRYARLAQDLTGAGFAVMAHDHRGHGRTEYLARGHMGDDHGWDRVVNDLLRVTCRARESFPGLPLFLLGHSWGSLLARDYAARWGHQLAGLVLIGTAGDPGPKGIAGQQLAQAVALLGRRRPSRLLDRLTFGKYNKAFAPNRTDFDWLSTVDEAVDAYVADPDCGFVCSAQFYVDLIDGTRRVNRPASLALVPKELPVLVVAGEHDPVGDAGRAPRTVAGALRAAGLVDVTCDIRPGTRHEVLHEWDRDALTSKLVAWLRAKQSVRK